MTKPKGFLGVRRAGDYVYIVEITYNKGKSWCYSSTFLTEHNAMRSVSSWNRLNKTVKRVVKYGRVGLLGLSTLDSNMVYKYQKPKKVLPDTYDRLAMRELVDSPLTRGEL